ncbi:MAG TPA: POTRA domain-containing protein [Blastocatellia bacterium]|jgi:outer membrane translocation and assembly module TamA|nr:POTRA domain-containing protein [Blastocatellia bacterium]
MRIYIRRSPLTLWLAASFIAFVAFAVIERPSTASTAPAKVERQQAIACVFDNFVWFKDQEIVDEVRKDLPSFDGSAPESGDSIDKIIGALRRMLANKKLSSEVEYAYFSGDGFYAPAHIFSARYAKVPVCKIVFQNSPPQLESELQQAAKAVVRNNYSKVLARSFVEGRAIQIYRKYGYLRAAARIQSAEIDQACENSVVVQVAVEPGPEYIWDKAVWTGAKAISVQSLDSAIELKSGDVVNGLKIDAGLRAVYIAYQKLGYVESQIVPKPVFDDANKKITLDVAVTEGPQFHMGELTIKGVPQKDALRLKEKWTLKTGAIYDGAYLGEFINKLVADKLIFPDLAKLLTTEQKPDRQRLVIDVIIDFKVSPS